MSDTPVQRFYRFHAYVYDSTRWMILHGRRGAVDALRLRPDSRVLEIGCGTGLNFHHLLKPLDPAAGRLAGVDFSADMLARARRRCRRRGWDNVDLLHADASQLNLGIRFDAILFAYSLTMIPDWNSALRRAFEHLVAGGRLVVLDFGAFDGWGPLAPLMRAWLRANHVETRSAYTNALSDIFGAVEVRRWFGGYNFTAVCERKHHGSSH